MFTQHGKTRDGEDEAKEENSPPKVTLTKSPAMIGEKIPIRGKYKMIHPRKTQRGFIIIHEEKLGKIWKLTF